MRTALAIVVSLGFAQAAGAESAPVATISTAHAIVYVQPLGKDLADEDVALVATALREFYAIDVKLLARTELPPEAWYPPRKRWRADTLLAVLATRKPADGKQILGLTRADVSTTKGGYEDWGVMGLGDLDGVASVISSYRCRMKSSGARNTRERLAKVAVHEMGHNVGLDHCPTAGCLMHDGEGQVATTDGEYDLCERCRALLRERGRAIPDAPKIPWARP